MGVARRAAISSSDRGSMPHSTGFGVAGNVNDVAVWAIPSFEIKSNTTMATMNGVGLSTRASLQAAV
jgi:hypothetical protein